MMFKEILVSLVNISDKILWWSIIMIENDGMIFNSVFKQIKRLANKKPTSKIAMWIASELKKKKG